MSFTFQTPLALLLLAAIPVLVYFELRVARGEVPLRYSSTRILRGVPRGWRARLSGVPLVLRCLALGVLAVALSRPMSGRDPIRNVTDGIAIQMVLDRSGSMTAGMDYRDEVVTRFEAVKSVFRDFVLGNGKELAGRPDDLIGMIAFAGFPDTISPLTHSREALESLLEELDTIRQPGKDGTAIGDAIALGAARLKTAEEELELASDREGRFEIKSKVMILLTDGEQNAGRRTPGQAAALAAEWGIKIYTIGVASGGGSFSGSAAAVLEQIAESTGGLFRVATDERSLRAIYEEIDRLEKTEVEAIQYLSVREYFPPFALAALALVLLEILLSATLLRRLP